MDIIEVAKKLGVSVATISRALNQHTSHMVSERTRKKVHAYAEKIGYVPNRHARALSSGKTHTVGLVMPNVLESIFFNDYFIKILAGVYRILDEDPKYTCKVIILPRGKVLSHLDREVISSGLDGLLLSPYCDPALYGADFMKGSLKKWRKPIVVLNLSMPHIHRFNCIYTDHRQSAKRAVAYLIQKGHKRIAYIQGDHFFPDAIERTHGYQDALKEHGLSISDDFISKGNFLVDGGYAATLKLFKDRGRKATALFCANDEMAVGALRALKVLGIKCPSDVAVVGFDGLEIGEYLDPRLTTVNQPTREIGEAGTRLLLELMRTHAPLPVSRLIPSRLLIRESA